MIKCKVTYFFDGSIVEEANLDPKDFLEYNTEEELLEAAQDDLDWDSEGDWGDVDCNEIYHRDYDIPQAFIEEWKELKNEVHN